MSTSSLQKPLPVREPIPQSPESPPAFPPSAELGDQLQHLEQAKAEIDRRKAKELARLRELQDRD